MSSGTSSGENVGSKLGSGLKDAYGTFTGVGDAIRGTFNSAMDGAGDAIAGRPAGSTTGVSHETHSSSQSTVNTNAGIAAKGEAAVQHGIDKL